MAFTSQSRLCSFLFFHHVFFFPSGPFLRTFVLAWFLQYFERLGAPEVRKETLRKSMFLTLEETMSERGPLEGPKGLARDPQSRPRDSLAPPPTLQRLQNSCKTEPKFDESMKNAWLLQVKVDFSHFVSFNMFFLTSQDLL